jgi:RNA polymerase sigma-70 factor (ECF subfamily)
MMHKFIAYLKNIKLKKGLIAKDPSSIDALFDIYASGLYQYALSITRQNEDAEEVVQNFFFKLIQNPEILKSISNLRVYLYKSIRNNAIDLIRRRKYEFSLEELVIEPQSTAENKVDNLDLINSFKQLSPNYQEIIFLKFYQDLNFREIGSLLEISPNTAASRYRYAVDILRKKIGGKI